MSDLVNAAFDYLIQTGELPDRASGAKGVDPVDLQKAFLESLSFLQVASVDAECVKEACLRGWDDFEDCLVAVKAECCCVQAPGSAPALRSFLENATQATVLPLEDGVSTGNAVILLVI